MVDFSSLEKLPEAIAFRPKKISDERGYFIETFRQSWMVEAGIDTFFCQDNQSFSTTKGTIRGLHFQNAPNAQGKLVRCLQGKVWDVAVDLRPKSPSFGVWDALELTAEGGEQLYIPEGFGHGFLTLTDNCIVAYKCTAYYNKEAEGAVHYADPSLAISWPIDTVEPALSPKDSSASTLEDFLNTRKRDSAS